MLQNINNNKTIFLTIVYSTAVPPLVPEAARTAQAANAEDDQYGYE
jgi:hypothetical protein